MPTQPEAREDRGKKTSYVTMLGRPGIQQPTGSLAVVGDNCFEKATDKKKK